MAYTVRPPKEKLRIVLEGIGAENISELCRREGICPKDYYRYRDKVVDGALEALRRNGRKKQDPEAALESSPFSALQACKVLGLSADRFYGATR